MGLLQWVSFVVPPYSARKLTIEVQEIASKAVADELLKKMADRDVIVRDLSLAVLDKATGYMKLLVLPFILAGAILGIFGIKDATQFLFLINPRIAAAQSQIESQIKEIKQNKVRLSGLNGDLISQRARLTNYDNKIEVARLRVSQLDQQVSVISTQVSNIEAKNTEDTLQQDFASLVPGEQYIVLDGKKFRSSDGIVVGKPVVYLTASADEVTSLTFDEVRAFSQQMAAQGYDFIHGFFALYRGQVGFGANLVPFSQCTNVVYFNKSDEGHALAVAKALASTFKITVPNPILIDLATTTSYDDTAVQIIKRVQVRVAASVASPEPRICSFPMAKNFK